MQRELYPLIASNLDSSKVAKYVQGAVLAASALIIFFAQRYLQIALTTDNIVTLASGAGTVAGAIWTIYGIIMKLVAYFGTKHPASDSDSMVWTIEK